MTRSCARSTALAVLLTALCGCQTPKSLHSSTAPPDGGILPASHSKPRSVAGLFSPPKDDAQKLLKQATEFDNANRSDPQDRESLRAARLAYEQVLQLQPSNAYALHRLGTISDREGRFPEAEQSYLAALRLSPNSAEIHSDLGYSYLLQNRLVESEQSLRRAMELNPQQPRARVNLGIVMARAGQMDQAYELIRAERGDADARAILAQHAQAPQSMPLPGRFSEPGLPAEPVSAPRVGRRDELVTAPEQVNEATRSLTEAIRRQRANDQAKKAVAARESAALDANGMSSSDVRIARQYADRVAANDMNQQLSDIDRGQYRAPTASQPPQGFRNDPRASSANGYADTQRGDIREGYDEPPRQQHIDRSQQRPVARQGSPIYIAPPGSAPGQGAYVDRGTGGAVPARQTSWDPNSRPYAPDAGAAQREAWERARHEAVRMGFEAGGGSLFPTEDVGQPQQEPDPRMARGIQQTGYNGPPADLWPSDQSRGPAPATAEDNPDLRSGPEKMAELDLLNDQMRQIQEQISQKRSLLQQQQYEAQPNR